MGKDRRPDAKSDWSEEGGNMKLGDDQIIVAVVTIMYFFLRSFDLMFVINVWITSCHSHRWSGSGAHGGQHGVFTEPACGLLMVKILMSFSKWSLGRQPLPLPFSLLFQFTMCLLSMSACFHRKTSLDSSSLCNTDRCIYSFGQFWENMWTLQRKKTGLGHKHRTSLMGGDSRATKSLRHPCLNVHSRRLLKV